MFLSTCVVTVLLAFTCFTLTGCDKMEGWEDDMVILSAAELVNLVRLEQGFVASDSEARRKGRVALETKSAAVIEEEPRDEDTLKGRKVWSRWSKWSKCSNTCGPGTMTRRRLCVAGRCAPGEKEEQHRTCEVTPCEGHNVPVLAVVTRLEVPTDVDQDPDALE